MEREEFSARTGSATSGRLVIAHGVSDLKLHAAESPEELYRARFEGIIPEVRVEGGVVTVEYPNVLNPFKSRSMSADIGLSPKIPWEIEVRGGAAGVGADLMQLRIERFGIKGGVSDVEIALPETSRRFPVEIDGGASSLTVRHPKSLRVSLEIVGGAASLTFDDQQFGAIGGKVSLRSAGYEHSEGSCELRIAGGASNVLVLPG